MKHIYLLGSINTDLVIETPYVPKEGESIKRYLGSGIRLKEEVQKYGRKFFTKEILAYAYSQEELNQLEKEWISAVIGQDDCLNNYINTERKEYIAFCPICNKETFHYKGGLCKACFARKQYDNNNVAKYFKKDYQVKWCSKCQKETQHSGANYNNCAWMDLLTMEKYIKMEIKYL